MIGVINPFQEFIRQRSANPFHGGAHTESLLTLVVVGLAASVPLVYLWFRAWQLRRGFNQFWKSKAYAGEIGQVAVAAAAPRKPLLMEKRGKPTAPKPAPHCGGNGGSEGLGAAGAMGQSHPVWVSPAQTQSAAVTSLVAVGGVRQGVVNFQADDSFCEVFVNGEFFGNTPAKLTLREGSHLVEMKREGCKAYRRQLSVHGGSEVTLRAVWEDMSVRGEDSPATAREKS